LSRLIPGAGADERAVSRTDRHDDVNGRYSQFCERAKKTKLWQMVDCAFLIEHCATETSGEMEV